MELTFLGAAREVGRSCVFVSSKERVMLDCGVKIHSDSPFPVEPPAKPDFAVISHAHLDHSGFSPVLYRHDTPELICTPPTKAMADIIIEDSMRLMAKRGEYPYKASHIKRMDASTTLLSFGKWYEIGEGTVTLYNGGHIPGASIVDLDAGGGRVVYSGDFKREETKTTFRCDYPPPGAKALIIESTYADRDHPQRRELEMELGKQVKETLGEGGSVLFPAFAIGRTQELMRIIRSQNRDVDIYIDGMGWRVSETLSHFSSYIKDFKKFRQDMSSCKPVMHKKERERILKKQCVIISTAGMLQGGPALSYLLQMGPESRAIFTGYSVEETNGHNLLTKGFVEYDGVRIRPKARHSYLDFSAHAGRSELFEMVKNVAPEKVFCVHGDRCVEFAEELKLEGFDAHAPSLGETVKV